MSTYPNETWSADSVIEALDGTTDQSTGLPYIAKGTGPTSVPSLEVQYNRRLERLNKILAPWRQGMVVDEGNLTIGVYPIEFTRAGQHLCYSGATGVSVTDDTAKVVYLDSSSNLQIADQWPTDLTSYLPLASVTANGGELLIQDRRPLAAFYIPSLEAANVCDRRIVTAHRHAVTADRSDMEMFEFDPGEAVSLDDVQVYCSAVTGTASVDVKEAGVSLLSAAATPSAGTIVKPTISDPDIAAENNLTVHVTTGSGASISDLTVTLVLKAPLAS